MRRLAESGLTTREACGNSVRNITACPYAGVAADEVFDVTPYAEALTRYFLRHRLSSSLPRKFKIGFEGCAEDHVLTAINDIGWRARDPGRRARVPRHRGRRHLDPLPVGRPCSSTSCPRARSSDVAEAIVRVFHRLGDFKHKQRNRMKFLIKELGWDRWKAEFEATLDGVRAEGGVPLPFDPEEAAGRGSADGAFSARARGQGRGRAGGGRAREGPGHRSPHAVLSCGDFTHWRRTNVRRRSRPASSTVAVTLPLGDITSAQLRVARRSRRRLRRRRCARDPRAGPRLPLGAQEGRPRVLPPARRRGPRPCRRGHRGRRDELPGRGVVPPRGHAVARPGPAARRPSATRPDLVDAASDLKIKISGCPNGCGQHHIAGIGFQGSVRQLGDRVAAAVLRDGGRRGGRFRSRLRAVGREDPGPARARGPRAAAGALPLGAERRRNGNRILPSAGRRVVKERLADLEALTPDDAEADDYVDLGEDTQFKMEVQEGECSA